MLKIGIIATYKKEGDEENKEESNIVNFKYIDIIEDTGVAVAVIVPCNTIHTEYYADYLDGILIPGGYNVDPQAYRERKTIEFESDVMNDRFILRFINAIVEREKLLIGISRGMHLINTYFGGKLSEEIKDKKLHNQPEKKYETVHNIKLKEGEFLKNIYHQPILKVNSIHDQAISRLGDGIESVAKSEDGYHEAITHKKKRHIYGFQWDIEYLKEQHLIFKRILSDYRITISHTMNRKKK